MPSLFSFVAEIEQHDSVFVIKKTLKRKNRVQEAVSPSRLFLCGSADIPTSKHNHIQYWVSSGFAEGIHTQRRNNSCARHTLGPLVVGRFRCRGS